MQQQPEFTAALGDAIEIDLGPTGDVREFSTRSCDFERVATADGLRCDLRGTPDESGHQYGGVGWSVPGLAAVHVVHRRDQLRASKIMGERVLQHPKITVEWNSVIDEILGNEDDGVTGVRLRDVTTDETRELPCTGYFAALGHKPNTDLFRGILDLRESGYLITKPGSTYTNIEGVFACGDVQDPTYRQAITAAGSGCMAAIDAERWLEAQEG